jgi:hypothetical protein
MGLMDFLPHTSKTSTPSGDGLAPVRGWLDAGNGAGSVNILDLPQNEFIAALDEWGVSGGQRDRLIRQKRQKDSVLGGLFDFGATGEGERRASILPMTYPEGMSGLEAITSGAADLAIPGILTGTVAGAAQAVDAPRAAFAGQIPESDMLSEALNIAGIVSLGGAGAAGRGLFDYQPDVTRIFAGPKAANADLKALERAKRLAASSTDRDTIWNETGWFKLPDGQWRFEIPDNDVGLRPFPEALSMADEMRQTAKDIRAGIKRRNADLRVQPDLFPATLRKAHGMLAREADTLERAAEGNYGPTWNPSTLGQRATYAITDSDLQRAYPELMRDTIVRTDQQMPGYFGMYDEGMQRLNIAPSSTFENAKNPLQKDKRKTLIHELQHAVQGFEGFARGTNAGAAFELLSNIRDKEIKAARDVQSEWYKKAPQSVKELLTERYYARERGDDAAFDRADKALKDDPIGREIIAADDAARAAAGRSITKQDAYDAYERHLGELEARLVAERSGWSPEERRDIPPWWMGNYLPEDTLIKSFVGAPRYPKDIFASEPRGLLER